MTSSVNFSTGRRNYVFDHVRLIDVLETIMPLIVQNQKETGVYGESSNHDYARYLQLDDSGDLRTFVISSNRIIVGYSIFFIDTEIFQADIISARQSIVFVDKGHRGVGLAFIKFCDDILRAQGVNSVWRQASAKFDVSKVYERLGYTFIEKSFMRRL